MGGIVAISASDGHSLTVYVTGLGRATKGIVVIQEIFGLNHHIRDMADRLAAAGYSVCAPALFDRIERGIELGYTPGDIANGRNFRMKLADSQIMADVEAAADASCWYGGGIAGTRDERPKCPLQMHFGETDTSIPMSDVDAIRTAQPKTEVYVYEGASHGFGCDERASFSKQDYDLAQQRTVEFFARHLG